MRPTPSGNDEGKGAEEHEKEGGVKKGCSLPVWSPKRGNKYSISPCRSPFLPLFISLYLGVCMDAYRRMCLLSLLSLPTLSALSWPSPPCSSLALLAISSCPILRTVPCALEPALPHTALCVSGGREEEEEEEDEEEEEEEGYAEAEAVDDDAEEEEEEEEEDDEEEEYAKGTGRGRGGRIGSMFAALSVDEGE